MEIHSDQAHQRAPLCIHYSACWQLHGMHTCRLTSASEHSAQPAHERGACLLERVRMQALQRERALQVGRLDVEPGLEERRAAPHALKLDRLQHRQQRHLRTMCAGCSVLCKGTQAGRSAG